MAKENENTNQVEVSLLEAYALQKARTAIKRRLIGAVFVGIVTILGAVEYFTKGSVYIFVTEFAILTGLLSLGASMVLAAFIALIGWFAGETAIKFGATRVNFYTIGGFVLAPLIMTLPIGIMANMFEPQNEKVQTILIFSFFFLYILSTMGYCARFIFEKYRQS